MFNLSWEAGRTAILYAHNSSKGGSFGLEQQIVKVKNKKGVRVIPGFGLSMGVTLAMLSCIVLIPLASIFISVSKISFQEFVEIVTSRQVM